MYHSDQVINFSLILKSLSQKISLSGTFSDVFGNGGGLGKFEISFNEIG